MSSVLPVVYNDVMDCIIELYFYLASVPSPMEHTGKHFVLVESIYPDVILVCSVVNRIPVDGLSAVTPLSLRGSENEFNVELFKSLEAFCRIVLVVNVPQFERVETRGRCVFDPLGGQRTSNFGQRALWPFKEFPSQYL